MEGPTIAEKKNTFTIPYMDSAVTLSGDFDSGNLNNAVLNAEKNEIELCFGRDRQVKPSAKCWFHFSLVAKSPFLPVKLFLTKTNSLNIVSKVFDLYRPVVKVEGGEWERYATPIEYETSAEGDTSFRMTIDIYNGKKVYVALCYPWSFQENEDYLDKLALDMSKRSDIYFNKETLIYSPGKRPLHLIAISSPDVANNQPQQMIEHLFPNSDTERHLKRINKPMILITARVHPGEIGASYSMLGMLELLTSRNNEEVKKILNEFYFLIVPMLNPDGVAMGHNRMDIFGQNLNRFYLLPDLEQQPSCFAVKSLVENCRQQLYAFFDLHGHANKKSCFLFGNSINNSRLQVESVLFAKYFSTICDKIEFKSCNFSKKQMATKDKGEDMSKEGCARVVIHKWTNSPYCYTLQTGLYKDVKIDEKGIERYGEKFYTPETYREVGEKMILSLFRVLKKSKTIEDLRKEVIEYVAKLDKVNNGPKKTRKESMKEKSSNEPKSETVKQINKSSKEIKHSSLKDFDVGKIESKKGLYADKEKENEKYKEIEVTLKSNKAVLLEQLTDY